MFRNNDVFGNYLFCCLLLEQKYDYPFSSKNDLYVTLTLPLAQLCVALHGSLFRSIANSPCMAGSGVCFNIRIESFSCSMISWKRHGISDLYQLDCLFNCIFRLKTETKRLCFTDPLLGIALMFGGFPSQRAINMESLQCHGIIMSANSSW